MSSKPKKRKHHKEKKKRSEMSSLDSPPSPVESLTTTTAARPAATDLDAQQLTVNAALHASTRAVLLEAKRRQQREESAGEILQASLNFKRSHTAGLRSETTARDRMLYPSVEDASLYIASREEKQEETEFMMGDDRHDMAVAMAPGASVGSGTYVYIEDDDPVIRKILEEERLLNRAKMESASTMASHEMVFRAPTEDSKPPAQAVAYASIRDDYFHPADLDFGVQAELVGEADYSPHEAFSIPTMPTIAMISDEHTGEEATVLDSKPAALPSGWASESAEATVLGDSNQHLAVWTTHHGEVAFEEIAVTGRDEAEATIVEIGDDIHPADLDSMGVQAELIGRDYSHSESMQGRQAWALSEGAVAVAEASPGYAVPFVGGDLACESYDVVADRSSHVEVVNFADHAYPADAEAEYLGTDYLNGDTLDSQIWTAQEQLYADSVNHGFANGEAQAVVLDITEDVHPADLEAPGVRAEFLGREYSQENSFQRPRTWAETDDTQVTTGSDGVFATVTNVERAGDGATPLGGQATAVAVVDEFNASTARESTGGVRAELFGRNYERAESLPSTVQHAHALLISPVESSRRSVSSPACHLTNPFEADPSDTPAMSRDGLAALDAMELNSWTQRPVSSPTPVKVIPPPPPIPSRSGSRREHSHTSNNSRVSSAGSSGDSGGVSARGELLSQAQRAVNRSRAQVMRHTNNVMERLFGSDGKNSDVDTSIASESILPRTLLPWSVFQSETTGMWVATVNTNQKALDSNDIAEASKALRAFSVPSREQAEALARAWAPPRMLPFSGNNRCFVCEARFAVFKRPCHCRNCGVCICSGCAVQWPSKMIPDTYNIKQETIVNICKSCDWLCSAFRMAMLDGNFERAVAIHSTDNVNLVTPFANVKGELFYPVHCAVLGGSLELLQWLVDTHCCPLRSIRISGKTRQSSGSFTPILTSRGRSLLGIAIENEKVDLVRYLVVDKGMSLAGEKDLNMGNLIRLLDRMLRTLPPPDKPGTRHHESDASRAWLDNSSGNFPAVTPTHTRTTSAPGTGSSRQSEESWRADEALAFQLAEQQSRREEDSQGSVDDACIICFANSIDCVVTPCGHQICCIQCSTNISRCPVCGVDCCFIRVFRAN